MMTSLAVSAIIAVVIVTSGVQGMIEEIRIHGDILNCYDTYRRTSDITRSVGYNIHWKCMQMYMWNLLEQTSLNITLADQQWIESITSIPALNGLKGRKKRQNEMPRVRREYRRMSNQQRENYHRAVSLLKQIPIANTTRYDFIANIHRGDAIPLAHRGPNFLGWHRVYLIIYENALRQVVPGVTIPYWASSLDNALEASERTQSVIWSDRFFGNGDGFVTSGPYSNWQTQSGPLIRNIGLIGELFSIDRIARILNRTRTSEITFPSGAPENRLEDVHDGVHVWVGGGNGQMNDLNTAAQDPIFFSHHAFVDYLWEEFRQRQIQLGIDPSLDYPVQFGLPQQAPQANMRFGNLRNIDGYSNLITTNIYQYEASPTCRRQRPTCGSDFLRCDTNRAVPHCITVRLDEARARFKRQASFRTVASKPTCSGSSYRRALQNRYLCSNNSDIREWSYIPVDIVYRRPPEFTRYQSYPVFNGQGMVNSDIYSPSSYVGLASSLPIGNPAKYSECMDPFNNAGKIFIESNGLNHYGSYSEFVMVDNRLAISKATGYVAVKSPDSGMTDVHVSAHDSCGRICRPYCRTPGSPLHDFHPCSGAIRITTSAPKLYGRTYGEIILDTWQFPTDGNCPKPDDNYAHLRFFCDYTNQWPWADARRTVQSTGVGPSLDIAVTKSPTTMALDSGDPAIQGCLLGHGCVVKTVCGPCKHGGKQACLKSGTMFAVCNGDKYIIRRCIGDSQYDDITGTCKTSSITRKK